jgi:uncharacterized pyridoxal phosphate-containing UPF0001 family protein
MMDADAEVSALKARLENIRARISQACRRCDRDPSSVRLLPVTKTVSAERLRIAVAAGLTSYGENKVQEAREKAEALADLAISWSIIGHLQTNKVKYVARFAAEFQALDSLRAEPYRIGSYPQAVK